ncbi:apolipoprotein N-acyltransferase [Chlamydiota bacterium]
MPIKRVRISRFAYFLLSFLLAAAAQPDWSVLGCILVSCVGYAIFWQGASLCKTAKSRFGYALLWFGAVSAIHLNWLFADRYVGAYIYPFIVLLCIWLGVQFGLATLLIGNPKELGWLQMLGISGGWALCEWSRLFILSGYSLDPVGIALSGTLTGMQMTSAIGVYGLSFWVFFTNLLALRLINSPSLRRGAGWMAAALFPYAFGMAHLAYHTSQMRGQLAHAPHLEALLVQTALIPEEKFSVNGSEPYSPADQWHKILSLLVPHLSHPIDLIVLPEGTVPYGTHHPIYQAEEIEEAFHAILGKRIFLPPFPGRVGNRAWAQALADVTGAEVILGLEDVDVQRAERTFQTYNAAFLVRPFTEELSRYEKRVLVPMGEYIPFNWCKKILSKYGIMDSFTPGKEAKVFPISHGIVGVSICYEETYGYLMRQSRLKGADILVNLTNDVWYPRSRLPAIHFFHGRLRALEAGVPILRACNTGVTCAVDALGRIVGELPCDTAQHACTPSVLTAHLPRYHYPTLYTRCGDALPMGCSAFLFTAFFIGKYFKRKQFKIMGFYIYPLRKN